MKTFIIAVGDELLSGRTLDYNSYWISKRLTGLGFEVSGISVVPDSLKEIEEIVLRYLEKEAQLIVITGGLGPTPGDITLEALSKALRRRMSVEPRALEMVKDKYRQLFEAGHVSNPDITEDRKKMAILPADSVPIFNAVGVAPGVFLTQGSTRILVLPGVPSEMMYILEMAIPLISEKIGGVIRIAELVVDVGDESALAPIFREVMQKFPQVSVKSYPAGFGDQVRMRIIASTKTNSVKDGDYILSKALELVKSLIKNSI
ncbi:MAG: competence/damage-inducible protein A [Candidatus Jordarchaeum sp.]|uniref:competence/damage-inducible protein A n=1 Tax=Candidatus Jordarchaeum sp. TaxID=2823881 RepID=UPI00404B30B5